MLLVHQKKRLNKNKLESCDSNSEKEDVKKEVNEELSEKNEPHRQTKKIGKAVTSNSEKKIKK